jgi:hypothetical protein
MGNVRCEIFGRVDAPLESANLVSLCIFGEDHLELTEWYLWSIGTAIVRSRGFVQCRGNSRIPQHISQSLICLAIAFKTSK